MALQVRYCRVDDDKVRIDLDDFVGLFRIRTAVLVTLLRVIIAAKIVADLQYKLFEFLKFLNILTRKSFTGCDRGFELFRELSRFIATLEHVVVLFFAAR